MATKTCTRCRVEKDIEEFGGRNQDIDMLLVSLVGFKNAWIIMKETKKKS
jgi:hypothetical protein